VDGQPVGLGHIASDEVRAALHQICDKSDVAGQPVKAGNQQGSAALPTLFKSGQELRPVRVPASALDLGELGHELASVDLAGDGLTLRVKAQPARALAVGRNTVVGNEINHGSASIVAPVARQLPFVQTLNVGLDLYRRVAMRTLGSQKRRTLRRMPYKIEWIGTVALGISTEGGRSLAFSLEDGQQVPPEFKVGDPVKIVNFPEHPSVIAMGMGNEGYYEFTHIPTGIVLHTLHRNDMYKVEEK
jgi:hypothetical protein